MTTYNTIAKRIQIQTDDQVVAETPEQAALLIARGQSDAPRTQHRLEAFFEVEVLEGGESRGKFKLDANHHVVQPDKVPAPMKPVAAPVIPAKPAVAPEKQELPIALKEIKGEQTK